VFRSPACSVLPARFIAWIGLARARGSHWFAPGVAARVTVPIFAAIIYGLYNFTVLGVTQGNYLYTYAPVLGGVAGMVGLLTYYLLVVSPSLSKRSWKNLLLLLGFLPYLFLIYVIVFFGLYAIYRGLLVSFSVLTIFGGLFWIAIGYRGINQFYLMTEISKRHNYMEAK
jgi:hypothetical protein